MFQNPTTFFSCRKGVVSRLHATKSHRVNRPLGMDVIGSFMTRDVFVAAPSVLTSEPSRIGFVFCLWP